MVLPLLFSLGLPALAAAAPAGGVLAGLGATLGTAGMAGLGAGLGSFLQSGDIGEGIKTGLASFLGGKVLGGLTGSTSANAINAGQGIQTEAFGELAQPKFLQTLPGLTEQGGLLASQGMQQAAAGAFAPGVMPAALIGQTMSDAYAMNRAAKKDDDDDSNPPPMPRPPIRTYNPDPYGSDGGEGLYFQYQRPPAPEGYTPQYPYMYADGGILDLFNKKQTSLSMGGHPIFSGLGRQLQGAVSQHYGNKVEPFIKRVEQDARSEFGDEIFVAQTEMPTQPNLPEMPITGLPTQLPTLSGGKGAGNQPFKTPIREMFQETQVNGMAEGGEVEADAIMEEAGMNEKDVIVDAIEAVKGMSEQPEIALAMFVQKYGEEALRDLVGRVQSGEFDETVERFAGGEQGMVEGPGDGSGVDDMVPATLEGEQDVLLSDGEFVLRKNTTDALEKAYGGGFLDVINRAEEDAPKELKRMVG